MGAPAAVASPCVPKAGSPPLIIDRVLSRSILPLTRSTAEETRVQDSSGELQTWRLYTHAKDALPEGR